MKYYKIIFFVLLTAVVVCLSFFTIKILGFSGNVSINLASINPSPSPSPTTQDCTYTYSNWSECYSSGMQTRTVISSSPPGCAGGSPDLSQSCTPTPTPNPSCTDSNWTYALSPTTCPSSGYQTKTWTQIGTCSGGVTHPTTETNSCTYQNPNTNPDSPLKYILTYTVNNGAYGYITGPTSQTLISGSSGTAVTAMAHPGYKFINWSDGSTTPSRSDTATETITYTANFAPISSSNNTIPVSITDTTQNTLQNKTSTTTKTTTNPSPPPVACTNIWQFSLTPPTCPPSGQQEIKWTQMGTCPDDGNHPSKMVTCKYQNSASLPSANILSFSLFSIQGETDVIGLAPVNGGIPIAVTITDPAGVAKSLGKNLSSLVPSSIIISQNATISPDISALQDFTNPVTYKVTGTDASGKSISNTYVVTATKPASTSTKSGSTGIIQSIINSIQSVIQKITQPIVNLFAPKKNTGGSTPGLIIYSIPVEKITVPTPITVPDSTQRMPVVSW